MPCVSNSAPETTSANAADLLPAVALMLMIVGMITGLQLMPYGRKMLLVRLHDADPQSALKAAAMAQAAFVGSPAPGFAIVYGQAARVRAALGLAVVWKGNGLCSAK